MAARRRRIAWADDAATKIVVTDARSAPETSALVYHPPVLALGIGCERGCPAEEIADLARSALAEAGLAARRRRRNRVDRAEARRARHPRARRGIRRAGAVFPGRSACWPKPTASSERSQAVFRATGCWGVAEGAALAAAGAGGELCRTEAQVAPCDLRRRPRAAADRRRRDRPAARPARDRRHRSRRSRLAHRRKRAPRSPRRATSSAIASISICSGRRSPANAGTRARSAKRRRGCAWRSTLPPTAAMWRSSLRATPAFTGSPRWSSNCSTAGRHAEWQAVEITVCPGVSALQAAAARAGAPLGHDFCAISLSDLLTPWADDPHPARSRGGGRFCRRALQPALGAAVRAARGSGRHHVAPPPAADPGVHRPQSRPRRRGDPRHRALRSRRGFRRDRHAEPGAGRQQRHAHSRRRPAAPLHPARLFSRRVRPAGRTRKGPT